MGLFLLTKDQILADYLRIDCPLLTGVTESPSLLRSGDLCIVDGDSFPPPYPACTCLIIARKKQETQLPLLLRPLVPSALSKALGQEKDFAPHLNQEQRALVTENGSLAFPALEFAILELLFESNGATVSREALRHRLVNAQAGASHAENTDTLLTVYIYRLRKKLAPLGMAIISHHRHGYSLEKTKGQKEC